MVLRRRPRTVASQLGVSTRFALDFWPTANGASRVTTTALPLPTRPFSPHPPTPPFCYPLSSPSTLHHDCRFWRYLLELDASWLLLSPNSLPRVRLAVTPTGVFTKRSRSFSTAVIRANRPIHCLLSSCVFSIHWRTNDTISRTRSATMRGKC